MSKTNDFNNGRYSEITNKVATLNGGIHELLLM